MKIIIVVSLIKSVLYARQSAKFFIGLSFNHYNNLISYLFFIFFNLQTRTQIQRQKRNFSEVTQLVGSGAEIWIQVSDSQDPTLSTGLYPFLTKICASFLWLGAGEGLCSNPSSSLFTSPLHAWEPNVNQDGPLFVLARCGMIYMEPHQLGWKPLKDSYMDTLPSSLTEEHKELVRPSGPFPFCPSLSPDSSSQRPSRIVFVFIIMEGKEGKEVPWLSPITLLPGFLPLLFYFACGIV